MSVSLPALAVQGLSKELSRIEGCLEFFGNRIVSCHKNGDLSSQKSKLTSGVLFDLQQCTADFGKSFQFILEQHLSCGCPTSGHINSRVELVWPADMPSPFQQMLRGMQEILTVAHEIQTQLQQGRVQVTNVKGLLRDIASFINAMSVHLFPDTERLAATPPRPWQT